MWSAFEYEDKYAVVLDNATGSGHQQIDLAIPACKVCRKIVSGEQKFIRTILPGKDRHQL